MITNYINVIKKAFINMNNIDEYIHNNVNYLLKKQSMQMSVLNSKESGITDISYDDKKKIIVSLTTHGKRINYVYQAIESIFQQTCKANKVILYISKDNFNINTLPQTLINQTKRGLEIHFVEDIGVYTKLIPALLEYPKDNIITIDDDYIYPFDLIEKLIKAHKLAPQAVCCSNSRIIKLDKNSNLKPYFDFEICFPKRTKLSHYLLAEGFGGVLYPPNSLHPDVIDIELFKKLSPHADDLWYKGMELLNDTPVLQIERDRSWFQQICREEDIQDVGLKEINFKTDTSQNRNDLQLKDIFEYYNLHSKLSKLPLEEFI